MPAPWESYGLCNTSSGFPSATRQVAMRKVAALTLIATTVGYTTVDKYPATLPEDSNVDVVVVVVVVDDVVCWWLVVVAGCLLVVDVDVDVCLRATLRDNV